MSAPGASRRPRSALLVLDVQRGVVAEAHERDAVVARIAALVERARAEDVPVIWLQHSDAGLTEGSPEWEYVPELVREPREPLVHKHHGDAFEGTDLEEVLAGAEVGRLLVVGAETDACIRSTIHGAFARGYDVTLVADAHTTADHTQWGAPPPAQVIAHTNLYWQDTTAPGREAAVVGSEDVELAPARTPEG